jgi:hypothetical protein
VFNKIARNQTRICLDFSKPNWYELEDNSDTSDKKMRPAIMTMIISQSQSNRERTMVGVS